MLSSAGSAAASSPHLLLHRATAKYSDEVVVYRAKAATCNVCPLKERCTEGHHGRIVRRSFSADCLEKVRSCHTTKAY